MELATVYSIPMARNERRVIMRNFTVGPVQSDQAVLEIGSQQVPYFRTPEFSAIMLESEQMLLRFANAPEDSRVAFLTGSGTASMEAVVANAFSANDRVLVVNGGSFGQRFCQLFDIYNIAFTPIVLQPGVALTLDDLDTFDGGDYTAFVVNIHETSTGVLYDLGLISDFCARNNLFLVVDAISSFLADPLDIYESGIGALIVGSQKALACPPGVSMCLLAPTALQRVSDNPSRGMYLNLKLALEDGKRGQTPFTPAVGTLLQIHARLRQIERAGGPPSEIARIATLAQDFRSKINNLPLALASDSLSNAVTPLKPLRAKATDIFTTLKDEYEIWVCPNGGQLADVLFRVGHLGALTTADNDALVDALCDMHHRGLI